MSSSLRDRVLRVALATALALLCGCTTMPGTRAPSRLALVIGNASYANAPVLKSPADDATDMCAALRRVGFRTLCHTDVRDRAGFDASVADYVEQLGPNTIGVFYYSGHGVQVGAANFMIPTQVESKAVTENPLRVLYGVDDLFDRMRAKPARFQLVILDACRTDLFAPVPRNASGQGAGGATRSLLVRSLGVSGGRGGLAAIKDAPASTMVLYATASNDEAYDGKGRNSPLTKHVLANIETRGVEIGEFIRRVMLGMEIEMRDYERKQTPFIYGSFSGKFCFADCRTDPPPPAL